MGRRNLLTPYKIITNASMASTVTGPVSTVTGFDGINLQAVWTGTPTGSFTIQASPDQVSWTPLAFANPFTASGSAGNFMADISTNAPYLQIIYTPSSGTGILNVTISGKSVGA